MPTDEELLDEEEPRRLTHVIYNTALGHVRIRAEDSLTTTVEVPAGEVRFRRVVGAAEPEVALWLGSVERTFLGRMLEHVLSALRITPEARAALEAVRQKLDELGPPLIVASEGDDGAPAEAPPILEAPRAPDGPAARAPALADVRRRGRARPPTAAPARKVAPSAVPLAPPAPEESGAETRPAESASQAPTPALAGATAAPVAEALPSSPDPSAPAVGITFETVWRDLQALQVQGPSLHALAGQASSEIREVAPDGVWLYSHGLGREYFIPRDLLEGAWTTLVAQGYLVPRELRGGMSYGAATLLAHLPYVEYSADPITLYFPATAPHPLGTVRRRDLAP